MRGASPELAIEVRRENGSDVLGRVPAALGPIFEHAAFRGVLDGWLNNDGRVPHFDVELRLAPEPDRERIASLALRCAGAPELVYPWTTFENQAQCLVEKLLAEQRLEPGERVRWRLRPGGETPRAALRPRARLRAAPYPLREVALREAELGGRAEGELEVAIARSVLDARRERLLGGDGTESAALLLGQLQRDAASGAARLLVLDQIPLAPGRGGASRTHFALDASSLAPAAEAARARPELVTAGWFHDHPACAECALRPACANETVCFSTDDYSVHASAFNRAYQVALVGGKLRDLSASTPGFRLYGWDRGRISELPFRTLSDAEIDDRRED